MNAHLALEIAVCILTLDEQNCGFETCLVAVKKVEHADLEVVLLAPVLIHTDEHLRPVLSLGSARARVESQQCVLRVVFAVQKRAEGLLLELVLKFCNTLAALVEHGEILFLVGELYKGHRVVKSGLERSISRDLIFKLAYSLEHLL